MKLYNRHFKSFAFFLIFIFCVVIYFYPRKIDDSFPFPKKIHIVWNTKLEEIPKKSKYFRNVMEWKNLNNDFEILVYSEEMRYEYVQQNFKFDKKIVETYNKIPYFNLRTDFFRYLVLYNEGGVYTDIDVCEKIFFLFFFYFIFFLLIFFFFKLIFLFYLINFFYFFYLLFFLLFLYLFLYFFIFFLFIFFYFFLYFIFFFIF